MLAEFVQGVTSVITGLTTAIATGVGSIANIFWTPSTESGGGGFTFLGYILMVGLGYGIIMLVINLVKQLTKVKK